MRYEAIAQYLRAHNAAIQNGDTPPSIDALPPSEAARVARFLMQASPQTLGARQNVGRRSEGAPAAAETVGAIDAETRARLLALAATLVKPAEINGGAEALK